MIRPGIRIALDLGQARVGVARCDPAGILAVPLAVWPTSTDWLAELRATVAEYEPLEILVGLPVNLSGDEAVAADGVRDSASAIQEQLPGVVIRLVDERMTTAMARKQLRAAGHNTRSDRQMIDAQAATVLLQDALDAESRQGQPPGEVFR